MKKSKTPGKKKKKEKSHSARRVRAKLEVGHRPRCGLRLLRSVGPAAEQGGRSQHRGRRACAPSVRGVHWSPSTADGPGRGCRRPLGHRLKDHFITTALILKLFVQFSSVAQSCATLCDPKLFVIDTVTKSQLAFIPGVLYFP